ncbi:MAG: arsenate reductase ArsC [Actinobacteria bacterium]|nr:arsenate reductase ArsC [Actinomycetota bacterium]
MKKVLFLCNHNSCRSQMAEGLLRSLADGRYEAFSAGSMPSSVHPKAVEVMAEIKVDISKHRTKNISEFIDGEFDFVITVCREAGCPFFPGKAGSVLHWEFDDPAAVSGSDQEILAVFRRVRDEITGRILSFIAENS